MTDTFCNAKMCMVVSYAEQFLLTSNWTRTFVSFFTMEAVKVFADSFSMIVLSSKEARAVQVILCQKHSFLHQLTQNMTSRFVHIYTNCSKSGVQLPDPEGNFFSYQHLNSF